MRGLILSLLFSMAAASKILVMPNQETSHIRAMANTGRALADRGHGVTITVLYVQKQGPAVIGKMQQMLWGDPNEKVYFSNKPETSQRMLKNYLDGKDLETLTYTLFDWPKEACDNLFKDKTLYNIIKEGQFDLAIIDGLPITRCNYIYLHSLGIPYISQTAIFPFDIGLISQYFYNPFTTNNQFTPPEPYIPADVGKQTFFQRTSSCLMTITTYWLMKYQMYQQYQSYNKYSYDRPLTKSLTQLAAESQLWLLEHHPVLEFPRPKYDNLKYIGGMNWKPSKPLTGIYAQTANANGTRGFVVVSLGGDLLFLPKHLGDKLAATFKTLPDYTFIWANKGELTHPLPDNVIRVDWLPQNDLLGHKNCKLFITHCGNNGQFEAVGHGVPMLGVPIHRDQPSNAWRIIDKGYGQAIDLKSVSIEEFVRKIKDVIENPQYKANIMKARSIFHSAPQTPTEEAVYWVEHVLEHGSDHLKSAAMDMPWYQVLGYDILAFVILVIFLFIYVVKRICSLIMFKILGKRKSKKE